MMRSRFTALAVASWLLIGVAACDQVQEQVEDVAGSLADLTVRQIGGLAAEILDDPSRAEEILEANGIQTEQLDSILYEIASSPEATAEYLEALEEASN